jgi:PAS domain S-box-containing protein
MHTTNPYKQLVENLNDIVYATDTNAVVTYISPNICQLSGYAAEEVIGNNFTDFVHPEDLPGRIEQFLKILGGAKEVTEYRYFTKRGEMKWARTSARPIRRNGQVAGIQGILVDITDRKAVEEALKRSEEKYRILVQHAKDAIFVVQDEHIRFMNPIASEILGYTCDHIADRSFIEFVHPDDRASIMDRYIRRMRGDDLSDRVSFRIINKDGDARDVDLNAVLITWEEKPAILNFLRDITLQKMMEAQLRNSQRMEALGTLAGGIAHNFNNLLMGILGNTSLALKGLDPSSPTCRYLEKINKLVQGGSKLTHQLLEYARGGSCEVGAVDLNQLVKDTSDTLLATKKQIRIHHTLSEDIPCLTADQGQIEQVLLNLLLNAADAMPSGGDLYVETSCLAAGQVEEIAELSPKKAYVLLKVTDCGSGIPKAIQDRIFEPFFTTKGFERGTGLGLSTAYGIIKNHNGKICVESEMNKGSSFFVYLPAGEFQPVKTTMISSRGP